MRNVIGIIGGMGPAAGVLLQNLIIELTPAKTDQEHVPVICFTDPSIPDRTRSLAENNGDAYVAAVVAAGRSLVKAGATILAMPCNTAHIRLADVKKETGAPFVSMIDETVNFLARKSGVVGILATNGTINHNIYQEPLKKIGVQCVAPDEKHQARVMETIYDFVKSGKLKGATDHLLPAIYHLNERGANIMLAACTELSLLYKELLAKNIPVVDPLRILAARLVAIGKS